MPPKQKLKLTYFYVRARAEIIRLTLAACGEDFEDIRVQRDEWPALKPKIPGGQLPVIEMNGRTFGQSMAILRYFGRKHKLYGKDDIEVLEVDGFIENLTDLKTKFWKSIFAKDAEAKAEIEKTLKEVIPDFVKEIDKTLGNSKSGWIIGSSITCADLGLYDVLDSILQRPEGDKLMTQRIKAHRAKVESQPGVKEYLARRPDTPF